MTDSEKKADPEILSEFIEKVSRIFDKERVEAAARKTGFVQRESVLTGHLFPAVFVFGMSICGTPTLEQLIALPEMAISAISISRPGFHQRINEKAVAFFEFMLSEAVRISIPSHYAPNVADNFQRILIIDSTSFQLPGNLAEIFAGSGGSASDASVKIQFGYDLKSFRFFYVIQEGNRPDNCEENGFSDLTMSGDLLIRDLGYFVIKNFKDTGDKGAYYLSRLKTGADIYVKDENDSYIKQDPTEIIRNGRQPITEREIWLKSGDTYIKTRLVVEKVPDAVYSQRMRNINKKCKKKGRTPSQNLRLYASANLYITNAPEEFLPRENCRSLYRIRWQIEIVFKSWKTNFSLGKVTGFREERIKCMIYAKLLFIFITSHIIYAVRNYVWHSRKREISEFRAARIIKTLAEGWFRMILCEPHKVKNFLRNIVGFISVRCLKIRQKDRIYPLELLENLFLT
jgi:IS4 transposase